MNEKSEVKSEGRNEVKFEAKSKEKPGLIPVRLGLTPEQHHSLRLAAAHANVSMTDFVKSVLLPVIMGKQHTAGRNRKRIDPAGQGGLD